MTTRITLSTLIAVLTMFGNACAAESGEEACRQRISSTYSRSGSFPETTVSFQTMMRQNTGAFQGKDYFLMVYAIRTVDSSGNQVKNPILQTSYCVINSKDSVVSIESSLRY